uniref:Uncharacterized protein n=1 Tax=Glossina pallidipes TaxID=7398 RepID=A0A1B0ADK1_GLOPL
MYQPRLKTPGGQLQTEASIYLHVSRKKAVNSSDMQVEARNQTSKNRSNTKWKQVICMKTCMLLYRIAQENKKVAGECGYGQILPAMLAELCYSATTTSTSTTTATLSRYEDVDSEALQALGHIFDLRCIDWVAVKLKVKRHHNQKYVEYNIEHNGSIEHLILESKSLQELENERHQNSLYILAILDLVQALADVSLRATTQN